MKRSIEQRAVDFAGDRSNGAGHGYPSWEATLIERGYVKGAKDQEKLMYSEEQILEVFKQFQTHLPFHYEFLVKEHLKILKNRK